MAKLTEAEIAIFMRVDFVAFFMTLIMDVFWVSRWPISGMASLAVAIICQGFVFNFARRKPTGYAQELGVFIWLVGAAFWMISELFWDEKVPAGVLHNSGIEAYSMYYGAMLGVAAFTCWLGFFVLLFFQVGKGVWPWLEASSDDHLVPWFLMEACWVTYNMESVRGHASPAFVYVGIIAGFMAMILLMRTMFNHVMHEQRHKLARSVADFCWVGGNSVWYINDFVLDGNLSQPLLLVIGGIFMLGASVLVVGEIACRDVFDETRPLVRA